MARNFIKRSAVVLGLGTAAFTVSGCDGVSVGVGYGYDPFYDSMLWNDYYRYNNINVSRPDKPDRPDRPDRPVRPEPPIAKPPARPRPPVARPPAARPPIHRPSGGRRR